MPEAWNAHLQGGVGGLNRSAGGHCTTKRPIAKRTGSRASQHFCERVRQLERSWDTYKLGEFPEVVLTHKHIAQVEVLDAVMAAIVARQFLASFVVVIGKNLVSRSTKNSSTLNSPTAPASSRRDSRTRATGPSRRSRETKLYALVC